MFRYGQQVKRDRRTQVGIIAPGSAKIWTTADIAGSHQLALGHFRFSEVHRLPGIMDDTEINGTDSRRDSAIQIRS